MYILVFCHAPAEYYEAWDWSLSILPREGNFGHFSASTRTRELETLATVLLLVIQVRRREEWVRAHPCEFFEYRVKVIGPLAGPGDSRSPGPLERMDWEPVQPWDKPCPTYS